jgi:hypothetical protein
MVSHLSVVGLPANGSAFTNLWQSFRRVHYLCQLLPCLVPVMNTQSDILLKGKIPYSEIYLGKHFDMI